METSLHRQLKDRYGPGLGGHAEVTLKGYRIDAVAPDGALIEVQSGALGPLRAKLNRLLPDHRIRVVKPVVVGRRIVHRARRDGKDKSARRSPKRGTLVDVFDDLVGFARTFPHANLSIELLAVEIDEVRVPRRRWPGYRIVDRSLREVVESVTLHAASDLWSLLPVQFDGPFTTVEVAEWLGRSIDFAQRVAYCLRLSGAAVTIGKRGNRLIYSRPGTDRVGEAAFGCA